MKKTEKKDDPGCPVSFPQETPEQQQQQQTQQQLQQHHEDDDLLLADFEKGPYNY